MCNKESQGVAPGDCGCGGVRTLRRFRFRLSFVLVLALATTQIAQCTEQQKPTLISQSEVKTIEPTNNPTKVFIRRRIFRKLVKENANSSSEEPPTTPTQTTTPRPRTLYSLVKRLEPQSSVTGNTLKTSMSNSQSLASRQKFNFQSLKTRLGLAASGMVEGTSTEVPSSTQNSSLVMIPLPPSQRKAYTPVIMQVSKSTTQKPEKLQTFKLNKMFVPIGIYGKVLENTTTEQPPTSSTPITSIRHKGTDSGEKQKSRKVKGIADSIDITYGRPNLDKVTLTTEHPDASQISITTEYNELFGGLFGGDNNVRRGDQKRRNQYSSNQGLSIMTPPKLGNSEDSPTTFQDALGSYSSYSNYGTPHKKFTPSSIVDSITDSMARIPSLVPSLFHKGLTSLASMTSSLKENPFEDDGFEPNVQKKKPLVAAPSSYSHKIPASVPGGYISGVGGSRDQSPSASEMKPTKTKATDLSEYETLEYFRKRPHLLAQLRRERAESAWRRSMGVRLSKGFKPVNAPDYLAREYYKSTTTQVTPEVTAPRNGKNMKSSWLLRNSNEYVADKNDKVVRMWRDLLDSFSKDNDPDFSHLYSQIHRTDEAPPEDQITPRRSSPNPNVLTTQWSNIKRKYSKDQINEAKERILTLLDSGYGDEALHDIADDEELQHHYDHHDTSSHMPPPPPPRIKTLSLTKGLSGAAKGAFKDIVKFFKLGVSVGTGHSREPVNYEQVADEQEDVDGGDWKPVRRPLISFSAGISLKNPLSKKPHHTEYEDHLTHYSSSSKPYIPTNYKGLTSYYDDYSSHSTPVALKPTPYSYTEDEVIDPSSPPQTLDYEEEEPQGYGSATSTSYALPSQQYYAVKDKDTQASQSFNYYNTLKPQKPPSSRVQQEDMQVGSSSWSPSLSNPNEYELVPSSVYLNGQHDPRDIAAVVKPSGVSDDAVRSVLPAGLRGVKILDYPGYSNLNSISQVLGNGDSTFKQAMKKLRENYVEKERAYLPVEYEGEESSVRGVPAGGYVQYSPQIRGLSSGLSNLGASYYSPVTHSSGLISALSGLERGNVFTTADRINNLGRNTGVVGGLGGVYAQEERVQVQGQVQQGAKDDLGFSTNYNLPSNIDPDIAALLKSELDKDDVPEDVRQEFMEAKEQEKKEQAQKQQQAYQTQYQASRRVDNNVDLAQRTLIDSLLSSAKSKDQEQRVFKPTAVPLQNYVPQSQYVAQQQYVAPTNPTPRYQAQSRAFNLQERAPPPPAPPVVQTRFFAPIPITPTLMTTALKNPRYASPVPRYVIELAKKLQGDKSVQGIVRVSAKRGRGLPPVEYLYPVKG